jgi:hypothetical protein
MKRKTFVYSLFAIWAIMIVVGLTENNMNTVRISLTLSVVPMLFAVGYLNSLIPVEYRIQDMEQPVRLSDFTDIKVR